MRCHTIRDNTATRGKAESTYWALHWEGPQGAISFRVHTYDQPSSGTVPFMNHFSCCYKRVTRYTLIVFGEWPTPSRLHYRDYTTWSSSRTPMCCLGLCQFDFDCNCMATIYWPCHDNKNVYLVWIIPEMILRWIKHRKRIEINLHMLAFMYISWLFLCLEWSLTIHNMDTMVWHFLIVWPALVRKGKDSKSSAKMKK